MVNAVDWMLREGRRGKVNETLDRFRVNAVAATTTSSPGKRKLFV
jgi:hypothetical protein